jgi:hypothetical protein
VGAEPGEAAWASSRERGCRRAYPGAVGGRFRDYQNGQVTQRRHRNGASGETRDGGYSILRRAGLGRWRDTRVKVVRYGWKADIRARFPGGYVARWLVPNNHLRASYGVALDGQRSFDGSLSPIISLILRAKVGLVQGTPCLMKSEHEWHRWQQTIRAEQRRKFGKRFSEVTLSAASTQFKNIYSATFFSRHYISIVDQQHRSLRLSHALSTYRTADGKRIVDRDTKVAVVGAGISGMTCAVALAARTDCIVHVFELDNVLLRRLWEAPFRFLHPTLNQWATTTHYVISNVEKTFFPFMNWSDGYAPRVAAELLRKFDHYRYCMNIALFRGTRVDSVLEVNGKPMILLDSDLDLADHFNSVTEWKSHLELRRDFDFERESEYLVAKLDELRNKEQEARTKSEVRAIEYDVIVVATGFGEEKQTFSRVMEAMTTDQSYWRSGNPSSYAAAGGFGKRRRKRVLIAGNGDSGITELLHYMIRDFDHHRVFEFFAGGASYREFVNHLHYRRIEIGDPGRFAIGGPVSWYWARRKPVPEGWWRSQLETKQEEWWRPSRAVVNFERRIYEKLNSTLFDREIGETLTPETLTEIENDIDDDLSAMASYEIQNMVARYFENANVDRKKIAGEFLDHVDLTIVGPTPTIYSRRQSPILWCVIGRLKQSGKFRYKRARLTEVRGRGRVAVLDVGGQEPAPSEFDAIVVRQGPDYNDGLWSELRRGNVAVSRYQGTGNPIPGDEIRYPEGGPPVSEGDGEFKESYLGFLTTIFRTPRWRRVIRRSFPMDDVNEDDRELALYRGDRDWQSMLADSDVALFRVHRMGGRPERAAAETLYRKFKSTSSTKARKLVWNELRQLSSKVQDDVSNIFQDLLTKDGYDEFVRENRRSDPERIRALKDRAIKMAREA